MCVCLPWVAMYKTLTLCCGLKCLIVICVGELCAQEPWKEKYVDGALFSFPSPFHLESSLWISQTSEN